MKQYKKYDIIIVGGGLAGLTSAIHLSNYSVSILVLEKKTYPHHKVCGEYVSNEILPYLQSIGVNPIKKNAVKISNLQITTPTNKEITTILPLGGFGISRYTFDNLLYNKAKETVDFEFKTVTSIDFTNEVFKVSTQCDTTYQATYVIGSFGKRSNLDKKLSRSFIQHKSPWLALKAHYDYDFPSNLVALHSFNGGYCGLSKTETGAVNACYLATYHSFKKYDGIDAYQENNMSKNKALHTFFSKATPLFDAPLTISQVSFQSKKPVENHIFMIGDSAGLIHPLCGNGMAMAIHSAKLFSELFLKHGGKNPKNRNLIENAYTKSWNSAFSNRVRTGRLIQRVLMNQTATNIGFSAVKTIPYLLKTIIKKTHGNPIS